MKSLSKQSSKLIQLLLVFGFSSGLLSMAQAQDNPIPSSWGGVSVKLIETYGNNNTKPLNRGRVTLDLKDPAKAANYLKRYPSVKFPRVKTSNTRGATFLRVPPSTLVGDYILTVEPKPFDKYNEYNCNTRTDTFRMGTGGIKNKTYNFKCLKTDMQNETTRTSQGGYDLTIQLKQNSGTRGRSLWVVIYDKDNKRLKWVRTSGTASAVIRAVDPAKSPYRIAVHNRQNDNKPLNSVEYNMSDRNSTLTINLDSGSGAGSSQTSHNNNKKMECHKVQVKSMGSARRYGSVTLESCPDKNGSWSIKPYKY